MDASSAAVREGAWSTARVPESERFALWQDVVRAAFVSVSVSSDAPGPSVSSVTAQTVGALGVSTINSHPQVVRRTTPQIQQQSGDVFFLNLPLTGDTLARQDGRTAALASGDFVIVDSTRPFELAFERPFEQVSLTLPHDLLAPLLPSGAGQTAIRVSGDRGIGAVASAAIRALAERPGAPDRVAAGALARQLAGLVALSLGGAVAPRVSSSPALLLQVALDEVERSLTDPDLTPGRVAERVNVSTRYLHRLFSDRGLSVGRWILSRRLERCRQELLDPVFADWTISDVAFRNGFRDPSYFSRAFKARYGLTPRQARQSVAGG